MIDATWIDAAKTLDCSLWIPTLGATAVEAALEGVCRHEGNVFSQFNYGYFSSDRGLRR